MITTWRYIEEDNVSADYGLATDEFLMSYYPVENPSPEPTLRLYTYRSHCALVGRFQNISAELNLANCTRDKVQIGRRPTGGGAIIMGAGQLGLCITTSSAFEWHGLRPGEIYERLSRPVIHALKNLGIDARFRPKNDLEVNGKKIAGLGVYNDVHGAILFHTSLLVDLDIPQMLRVLSIPAQKISDKALIRSVSQRITTVSREIKRTISVSEVRQRVKKQFESDFGIHLVERPVSAAERERIEHLAATKYRSEAWLFQRSPQADMTGMSLKKTPAGLLRIYMGLLGDTIKSVLITGDFLEHADLLNRIESQLKWRPLDKSRITGIVAEAFSRNGAAVAGLEATDVVEAIWEAALRAKTENHFTYRGSCYYPSLPNKKAGGA